MNIIAMDDELDALMMLAGALREAAPEAKITTFQWPEDALVSAQMTIPDVAFLDIHTTGMNGLTLARHLTAINPQCNIIFVTGYSEYSIQALEMYASGYVGKPVTAERITQELEHLRYPVRGKEQLQVVHELGPYVFDHAAQIVSMDGRDLLLKPKEFRLLCVLASAPNIIFSYEELFRRVWASDAAGDVRTVYAHVSRLRIKLGMTGNGKYDIEAIRGVGYRLSAPPVDL